MFKFIDQKGLRNNYRSFLGSESICRRKLIVSKNNYKHLRLLLGYA